MKGRRFSLLDAMIFVAATAVGLALTRLYYPSLARWEMTRSDVRMVSWLSSRLPSREQIGGLSLPLATWTLALFALQWRSPRPSRRRLIRQPGFAVNLAATVGIGLWAIASCRLAWTFSTRPFPLEELGHPWHSLFDDIQDFTAPAVTAAWVALIVGGLWPGRREPDWRGRLARFLGWSWIALYFLVRFDIGLFR